MILGLDPRTLRDCTAPVRSDADDDVETVFARAAWSGIAETGDSIAGRLIAAAGPVEALELAERDDVDRVRRAIEDGLGESVPGSVIADALARWRPRVRGDLALQSLRSARFVGASLVIPGDAEWPIGVDDLGDHGPAALWCRGNIGLLAHPLPIAIVGARAASGYGEHIAAEAAAGLGDRGFAIVSGAAYGIDGMAHRAALAGGAPTMAFLAGGVDRFYPSGHDTLLRRIAEHGVIVSELPCGSQPTRWRFLQRNRLIAAASSATVVVEAGTRSGSLNTAGHAATLGRPLGAVPGPVTSAMSAGCHRLLREFDAVCVTTPEEMAELVIGPLDMPRAISFGARDAERMRVFDALSSRAVPAEEVARRSGLSVAAVRGALGLLELEGLVRETPAGWARG
ncbi:MAG: dprA [Naasia sp.]|nr:dprA [Naasia sp.]